MSASTRLELRGMTFFGHHGALPAEHELGQDFTVDVTLWGDWSAAAASDRLADALDYRQVWELAREVVEGPPMHLLEAVADRLAQRALELPGVRRVEVSVAKHPPVPGSFQTFRVVASAGMPG